VGEAVEEDRLGAGPFGAGEGDAVLPGAALGGVLIGLLEALVVGYGNPTYRDPIVFGVLIVILIVKPTGLLGRSEREKV